MTEEKDKCRDFVDKQGFINQSLLIFELLEKDIFEWDNISNTMIEIDGKDEEQEIFEWWIISELTADKFEDKGEPILRNEFGVWWGRTTTGQAIMFDSIIQEIVEGF